MGRIFFLMKLKITVKKGKSLKCSSLIFNSETKEFVDFTAVNGGNE